MLLTIIADAYSTDQRYELAKAIDDVCSPNDNQGWSSAGLYCYWDVETHKPLYLGLSIDLPRRFRQHNGLIGGGEKGTKRKQINKYFDGKSTLGFSLFLQSSLDQPDLSVKKTYRLLLPGHEGEINIQQGEGELLKAFHLKNAQYPIWNRIGGARSGANTVREGHFQYFEHLTCQNKNSIFRNDLSIRELAQDTNTNDYYLEGIIHALRIMIVGYGPIAMRIDQAVNRLSDVDRNLLLENPKGREWIEKARSLGF